VPGLGLGASTGSFRLELLPLLLPLPLASGRLSGVIDWYLHKTKQSKEHVSARLDQPRSNIWDAETKATAKSFHPIRQNSEPKSSKNK
jgi:hypothetical protein